jgi:hypothetical protein
MSDIPKMLRAEARIADEDWTGIYGISPNLAFAAADRIEELEAALKFLIRCEEVNESAAKAAGQPYVNKGLDFARMLIGMEKKDD